jgi:hypothetical protein
MDELAISDNLAGAIAIILAVMFATVIFAAVSGVFGGGEELLEKSQFDLSLVRGMGPDGKLDALVIMVTYVNGPALDLDYLVFNLYNPEGTKFRAMKSVLTDDYLVKGDVLYIFFYDYEDQEATDYWYTDEGDMVFTMESIEGVGHFSPPGTWKLVIHDTIENRKLFDANIVGLS